MPGGASVKRDKDLVAGDFVGAVRQGFCLGAHETEVGAAVRLGQAHRACPLAACHFVQIGLLLLIGAVLVQRSVRAVRQAWVHRPGLVGAVEHFVEALVHYKWQTLAAKLWIARQSRPAAFDVFGIGVFETFWRGDFVRFLIELAALLVAADIERESHFAGEFAAFFEHSVDGINVKVGVFRNRFELFVHIEHFVHHELHVA
jgi:hypothetical protein